ncbi:transcriptional regulator family: Fungal Specific TF [Aspergillus niger]|nr:transcriptional regulator family: Fungal Specific TF [Aspergillus niger]
MVYSGKPSLACERCRPRRLKCDWGKPSCSQCIRAKVDCPGYRSALEYSFRDQSRDVIRKAQLKAERESKEISKRQKRTVKAIKEGTISCPSEIVRYALDLDAQFQSIMSDIPASMGYKTVNVALAQGVPTIGIVWGSQYHTYRDITVSSIWNNYRSSRLVLLDLIVKAVGAMNTHFPGNTKDEHHQLLRQCQQISRQLVGGICASVPFHLGFMVDDSHVDKISGPTTIKDSDADNYRASKSPHLSSRSPFGVPAAGGFALMWPLLIAADSGYASKELRSWIIDCLDKIGHSMGINQALAMAQLVREGESTRAWLSPKYSSPNRDGQDGGSWNEAEAL